MIRKYLTLHQIRILESLEKSNAIIKNDEEIETRLRDVGKTPTDIANEYGLNKNLILENIPILVNFGLLQGMEIQKKGRPGNYYALTPIGFFIILKEKAQTNQNEIKPEQENQVFTQLNESFPIQLISKHWEKELKTLEDYRYHCFNKSLDLFEFNSRERGYFSISITLPVERDFVSFEKHYFSKITTEKGNDNFTDELLSLKNANQFSINEINTDIENFLTFLFYYNLILEPKKALKIIKKMRKTSRTKKIFEQGLVQHIRQLRKILGDDFDYQDKTKLEERINHKLESILKIIESIIKNDKELNSLLDTQKERFRSLTGSIINSFHYNFK